MDTNRGPVAIVIPAYKPGSQFVDLVAALSGSGFAAVVVVDDGSGPEYGELFESAAGYPGVSVLRHAINLGKGAALKTAFNHVLCNHPQAIGAVTADADGQHGIDDILRVAGGLVEHPHALVLGVRAFGPDVPLRSRIGNALTKGILRVVVGPNLADTQTGLRGIPLGFLPALLRTRSVGYEFELDMLIAARHHEYPIVQIEIRTIYLDGNRSSHFNPLLDSMRIYFVLLRFSFVSLASALIDNTVFFFAFRATSSILGSQVLARVCSVIFNYTAARKAVFLSRARHREQLPRYLALVCLSGAASYTLIRFLHEATGIGIIPAKIIAEGLLFIGNFCVQRDFVFRLRSGRGSRHAQPAATDWTKYYQSVPPTAHLTRKYTSHALRKMIQGCRPESGPLEIAELGGANSCFLRAILHTFAPARYSIVDNNEFGLSRLRESGVPQNVELRNENVLALPYDPRADIVFSIGLIEHFDEAGTERAVNAHFRLLKPGGWAIISFPTPTLLYRSARRVFEFLRLWRFYDERPLLREEVARDVTPHGTIVSEKLLWPLVLTQHVLVVRKHPAAARLSEAACEG